MTFWFTVVSGIVFSLAGAGIGFLIFGRKLDFTRKSAFYMCIGIVIGNLITRLSIAYLSLFWSSLIVIMTIPIGIAFLWREQNRVERKSKMKQDAL